MLNRAIPRRTLLLSMILFVSAAYLVYPYIQARYRAYQVAKSEAALRDRLDPRKARDVEDLRYRITRLAPHAANGIQINEVWQRGERARAQKRLGNDKYDYIVLPVEENLRYYDRVARLMSARWLAMALHEATGKRVMSPEFAMRLLGKRKVHLDYPAINRLAWRVGAQVVHVYLDFKSRHTLFDYKAHQPLSIKGQIYIVLADHRGRIIKRFSTEFRNDGKKRCEAIFRRLAPAAVAALVGRPPGQSAPVELSQAGLPKIPSHISDLPQAAKTPLDNAVYLQLVAMLTPKRMHYERKRLFERSLLALSHVDPKSKDYPLLSARALFYLYRRQSALDVLSNSHSNSGKAFIDYLNGNYPQLKRLVPKINNPVLRIMAYLELRNIGDVYYKKNVENGISLSAPSPQWINLILSAGRDYDGWYAPNNIKYFSSLYGLFPEFDSDLKSQLRGIFASGAYSSDLQDYAIFKKIFDSASGEYHQSTHHKYDGEIVASDIWALYRNIAVANLMRQLERDVNIYGSYGAAIRLAREIEPWFMGKPEFMQWYAYALYEHADSLQGDAKAYAQEKAFVLAAKTVKYSGGENLYSNAGRSLTSYLERFVPTQVASRYPMISSCGMPRCDYPSSMAVDDDNNRPDALPYENMDFDLLVQAHKENKLAGSALDEMLKRRFDGAPKKASFVAGLLADKGERKQAVDLLKKTIAQKSASWDTYFSLGKYQIEDANYAEASKTFMSFPDFTNPPNNDRVATGYRAYVAGRELYWLGRYKEAMPLYEVASNLDVGSSWQFLATKYLSFVRNDYGAAIQAAYLLGQRYNDAAGFRDYLTILHLAGLHSQAEAGFTQLAPRFDSVYIWKSQVIGQRMESVPFDKILAWASGYLTGSHGDSQARNAAHYLVQQAVIDRSQSLAKVKSISNIDIAHGAVMLYLTKTGTLAIRLNLGGDISKDDCPIPKPFTAKCKREVLELNPYAQDEAVGFMYPYVLLKTGRPDQSLKAFLAYDVFYPLEDKYHVGSLFPYFAMAVSDANQRNALTNISKLLNVHASDPGNIFETSLSRAVVDAALARDDDSFNALTKAYRNIQYDPEGLLGNWYTLIQVAAWIHKKTGDDRFIDRAVEWARMHEVILPQDAWAYAFEARYAKRRSDRVRAAAFAEYLDPKSEWLSEVPASIRRQAHAWWPAHNPFKIKQDQDTKRKVTL